MERRVVTTITVAALLVTGFGIWYAFSSSTGTNSQVSVSGASSSPTIASSTTTTRPITPTTSRGHIATVPTRPPPSVVIVTPTTRPAPATSAAPPPPSTPSTSTATTTTTTTTTTSAPPTTTTLSSPAAKLRADLLRALHPSNRGAANAARVRVTYAPTNTVVVTWAIDLGVGAPPAGAPTCDPPTSTTTSTTSGTATITTTTGPFNPATLSTPARARYEAKLILSQLKAQTSTLGLHFKTVRLIGTYTMQPPAEARVVEVDYSQATVANLRFDFLNAFYTPPALKLVCINPAFQTTH
jgi:hypothetical protein